MKVLDLFSGIGGFALGLEKARWETVAFCEIDKHCKEVLRKHWPSIPIFEDITKLTKNDLTEDIDVICGGFPCQDISCAGKGIGITGARSSLWKEYKRLINEVEPKYAIIENVTNLRNKGLVTVLQDLDEIGYNAEWHCIPASAFGAPHRRDRIWIIAYPRSERWQGERESREVSELFADKIGQAILRGSVSRDTWKKEPMPRIAGSQLNPEFVEWMMGFPIGWTESISRNQRIKALGNSLVPIIPQMIAEILSNNILTRMKIMLDQKKLHEIYEYRDGDLYYKVPIGKRIKVGSKAGSVSLKPNPNKLYRQIGIEGKVYNLGRIIFFMFYGYSPEIVWYVDRNPLNTKIENLKPADNSQCNSSARKHKNNTSGYKGVTLHKNKEKWEARIKKNYETKYLGFFDTPEEAHKAYCEAAKKLHGEFANFG